VLRLFFALQPSPAQSAELVERVAPLVAQLQAQPVAAANLHATLCFLGAVPEEKLAVLREAADSARGRGTTLTFDALDHWLKPKILCATAPETAESAPARELAQRIGAATTAAGFAPDLKPFRAHLTLARKVNARRAAEAAWPRDLSLAVRVHCDRFVLMRSDRAASGSIYSVVASWPLDVC
jgi:2'-5' RNA ligase